jgi:hypothetical protein
MIKVSSLTPAEVTAFWGALKPFCEKALNKTGWTKRHTPESIYSNLIEGDMFAAVIHDTGQIYSLAILKETEFPLGRGLLVFMISGDDMAQWADLLHAYLVDYAQEHGIRWIDSYARPGLSRKYLDNLGYDYQRIHCTYEV